MTTSPAGPAPTEEGVDGVVPVYRERVMPPWWVWLVGLSLAGILAVAYGAALNRTVGWAVFAVLGAAVCVALWRWAPLVVVDERVFRAGEARLPLHVVAEAVALTPEAARDLRGRDADVRAYLCLRTWVATAVRVDLDDPQDPHPYWLVSTRHPADVVAALHDARAAAASPAGPA